MPIETPIDCIELLATQCFLPKLTDSEVSNFKDACSKENDIIKLALKVPYAVNYNDILHILYDTLPFKSQSFSETLPLFYYSTDSVRQRQCDLRFYLRDAINLATPRKRSEMRNALTQWLPSLLSDVTLQELNDIRMSVEEIQPNIRQVVLENYPHTRYPSLNFERPDLGLQPEVDKV
ncbi:uncharacterized protein DI49_5677 (plasmid) [Saccharomyces eubayanus]|uniref:uncharacterized protein n=1 Tax=Saccharomyces eubayanus TaxID=1080349 RepID=UPI0006C62D55|nr:hypothetical protein DI49_5677 [Saccharomyces eubayanus]KOG96037.1 hypothetical protein DI49_5677 [Saccharomyces eubayanus]